MTKIQKMEAEITEAADKMMACIGTETNVSAMYDAIGKNHQMLGLRYSMAFAGYPKLTFSVRFKWEESQ